MKNQYTLSEEIILPPGFKANGIHAGIKRDKKDLALIASDLPGTIAGIFTTNQVAAAPVTVCREKLASRTGQAIIVNSGNANACNGPQGMTDARRMAQWTADHLGIEERLVYVCSTGHIGEYMPMEKVEQGIPRVIAGLSPTNGLPAAEAIMTTDTKPKYCSARIEIDGTIVTLCGLAKGSGMIHPHMATMLAFITTDAVIEPGALQSALDPAVAQSFNRISVDSDTSTNDTTLVLANGLAGHTVLDETHPQLPFFQKALQAVCHNLALKMVGDGEGATKVITIKVRGAVNDQEADIAARAVAASIEVRCSWHSCKIGWGRVMCALGYSRARVIEEKVDIYYDGLLAVHRGVAADTPPTELIQAVDKTRFELAIDLNTGEGEAVVYSCDCTEEYVRLNTY